MVRVVRLGRNGHTVAMVVPLAMLRALGWNRGDLVAVAVEDGRLVARQLDPAALIRPASVPALKERRRTRAS